MSSFKGSHQTSYLDPKNLLLSFLVSPLESALIHCRLSHIIPRERILIIELLRERIPEPLALVEGQDSQKIMRKILNKALKAQAEKEELRDQIKKGDLSVLNLLVSYI
jgi:hypothetical protein